MGSLRFWLLSSVWVWLIVLILCFFFRLFIWFVYLEPVLVVDVLFVRIVWLMVFLVCART